MGPADAVRALVEPVLVPDGIEVVDVEYAGGRLAVTVDRPGGIDLDAITTATRTVSAPARRARPDPGRALPPRGLEPRPRAHAAHPGALRPRRRGDHQGQDHGRSRRRRRAPHRRRARKRRRRRDHRRAAASSPTPTSSGPTPCSSGARRPSRPAPRRNPRQRLTHHERRLPRRTPGTRPREGHLRRHPPRRAGQRAGRGLQAPARRGRRGCRHHRSRHRRDQGLRPGARRGRQRHPRVGRHAERLRPHRRADRQAGGAPAHP